MKKNESKLIRNIAVTGHGKSGKTSLAEAILFSGKSTDRLCKVDNAESVLDFEQEEKDRHMTIMSAFHHVAWKKTTINIIDTPGDAILSLIPITACRWWMARFWLSTHPPGCSS